MHGNWRIASSLICIHVIVFGRLKLEWPSKRSPLNLAQSTGGGTEVSWQKFKRRPFQCRVCWSLRRSNKCCNRSSRYRPAGRGVRGLRTTFQCRFDWSLHRSSKCCIRPPICCLARTCNRENRERFQRKLEWRQRQRKQSHKLKRTSFWFRVRTVTTTENSTEK